MKLNKDFKLDIARGFTHRAACTLAQLNEDKTGRECIDYVLSTECYDPFKDPDYLAYKYHESMLKLYGERLENSS